MINNLGSTNLRIYNYEKVCSAIAADDLCPDFLESVLV